jgi:hypothetical protein
VRIVYIYIEERELYSRRKRERQTYTKIIEFQIYYGIRASVRRLKTLVEVSFEIHGREHQYEEGCAKEDH